MKKKKKKEKDRLRAAKAEQSSAVDYHHLDGSSSGNIPTSAALSNHTSHPHKPENGWRIPTEEGTYSYIIPFILFPILKAIPF